MTTQEAYEKIRKYFSRPDAEYGFDQITGQCLYRLEKADGTVVKCAIGCLITKESYRKADRIVKKSTGTSDSIEQYSTNRVLDTLTKVDDRFVATGDGQLHDFLAQAQSAHDNAAKIYSPMSDFIWMLDRLAAEPQYRLQAVR